MQDLAAALDSVAPPRCSHEATNVQSPLGCCVSLGGAKRNAFGCKTDEASKHLLPFFLFAEPRLPLLLKMMNWSQKKLEDHMIFPHIKDPLTAKLEPPSDA